MYQYQAFGMRIASEVRLDELAPADGMSGSSPDLTIQVTKLGYDIPELGAAHPSMVSDDPAGIVMIWPGAAAVRVAGPSLVEIETFPSVPEKYLAFPLLGPVMGWVLHLKQLFVLHASAVVHQGKSIGFMGDKGAGKSTTASAFLSMGAQILTDDLLAFETDNPTGPKILPAFAQVKLNETSAKEMSVHGAEPLPLIMDGFEKRQFRLPTMHAQPTDCDVLLVLERGQEAPSLTMLDPMSSLKALMRFSYNVRFSELPVVFQERERCFRQAAFLAQKIRVACLRVPNDISRLPETVEFVMGKLRADFQ
jgi:hypothetical protein